MKAHIYILSTGVIAFGILGGNFTFNMLQCKRWTITNNTDNLVDHVCLHEWCKTVCHTSGKRIIYCQNFIRANHRFTSYSKSMDCVCITLHNDISFSLLCNISITSC